jgi:hypothetical protein
MDIRARILARPDLASALAGRDLDALTAGLNASPPSAVSERWANARTVLDECPSGKSIIRKLKTASAADAVIEAAWAFLLNGKGLDVGAASTRASIDEIVAGGGLTAAEGDELKSLALQPALVTRADVEAAMFNPDGSEK